MREMIIKKIIELSKTALGIYSMVYILIIHIIGIGIMGLEYIDFTKPIADIVMKYIIFALIFLFCNHFSFFQVFFLIFLLILIAL